MKKEMVAAAEVDPKMTKDIVLNNVVLRKAESQDVDKIHEVLKQAFRGLEGRGYSTQAIETAIVSVEEIKKRISLGAHVIVAELGNEIVGTVTGFEEHKSMHVCSLAVHPKYQNRGVAHQLMLHLEKIAHQKRCQKLFLCTAWAMKEAVRLYENLGYLKEGYLRNHFYGEDFIIFSKFIKRSLKKGTAYKKGSGTINKMFIREMPAYVSKHEQETPPQPRTRPLRSQRHSCIRPPRPT